RILADLNESQRLLQADPLLAGGGPGDGGNDRFRFNYVAAKGLQARVLLWRGDRQGALAAAREVLSFSEHFPWIDRVAVTADPPNANRVFHTELLFSVYVSDLYEMYDRRFSDELDPSNLLYGGT